MKLDFESIKTWLAALPILYKAIGLLVLLLLILAVLSSLFDSCDGWRFNRDVNKQKANINALENKANHLENKVNQDAANYVNAKEDTNEARNDTNMALNNYNAVLNNDYNGAGYPNANSARCRAYPERCRQNSGR